jgi:ribose transport system permease protein
MTEAQVNGGAAAPPATHRSALLNGWHFQQLALPLALLIAILAFSLLRPAAFFSLTNASAVLTLAAPLLIAALGLTVALVLGEIDLSIGSAVSLAGTVAICAMSFLGWPWPVAILAALVTGIAGGLCVGSIVVFFGANSLIVTLGMGTLFTGLEYLLTDQRTVYEGISAGYIALGQSSILGLNVQVWIALAIAFLCHILLERTEWGRFMYAAGDNPDASWLAGVPVKGLRIAGFATVGLGAAIAGILMTAQTASAFSNAGQAYLLPAFAAAFLGSTASPSGRFTAVGTLFAVLFIGVVQTGLTMLQLSTGAINVTQGLLLVGAVLLSRLGRAK